ncbi:hypothetical protein T4D_14326 [Trichinella pseudospiralis]|uniref:Uncharacterized protein n=1 Tax=Trichinella pseudospiralis TaxID=6337 RepID=A0A0V1FTJ3_TRIPS|nr:hypothetical protein T4D_14326 [Trichinella pseudospiralis]
MAATAGFEKFDSVHWLTHYCQIKVTVESVGTCNCREFEKKTNVPGNKFGGTNIGNVNEIIW